MTHPDIPPTVWVVRAGPKGRYFPHFKDKGCVAFPGYGVGDLTSLTTMDIRKAVREAGGNARKAAVLDMFRELHVWDGVVTPDPPHGVYWFGRISRPYRYDPDRIAGLPHTLRVKWLGSISRLDLPHQLLQVLGPGIEIFRPAPQLLLLRLDVWRESSWV